MSKIPRKTQRIFAKNSPNIAKFGSMAGGTGLVTNDVAEVQSLTAYTSGWESATLAGNTEPTLEDFNGLHYVETSQIAYTLQEGIPEYDSATIYYENGIVKKTGTTQLYKSITDDNTGNLLTDSGNWVLLGDLANLNPSSSPTAVNVLYHNDTGISPNDAFQTFTHGLGIDPTTQIVDVKLKCITPQYGYSAGDIAGFAMDTVSGHWFSQPYSYTDNDLTILGNTFFSVVRKDTGNAGFITNANWTWVINITGII